MRHAAQRILSLACSVVVLIGITGCSDSETESDSDLALARDKSAAIRPNTMECSQSGDGIRSSLTSCGPGLPCRQAEHLDDLSTLKSERPYYLARQTSFSDAWTCFGAPFVMYGDVQVAFGQGARGIDARKHFEAIIAATEHGEVRQIQGRPAMVGEGDNARGFYTSVEFFVDGTVVNVMGQPDVPLEEVIRVANSLDLTTPRGA